MRPPEPNDPLLRRLREVAQEFPDLRGAAAHYRAILPLLRDESPLLGPLPLSRDRVRALLEAGQPLLSSLPLDLDPEPLRGLAIRLAGAVEQVSPPAGGRGGGAAKVLNALEEGSLDPRELFPPVAQGDWEGLARVAERLGLDPGLAWTLAENALKPTLWEWQRRLAPLAEGVGWGRGHCFTCGAPPVLGELQGAGQARHLRCGRCGADWGVSRTECPFCRNPDHLSQKVYFEEGRRDTRRIEACDRCRGYLKVIAAYSPSSPEMLAVEDLATLHLDSIAQERGYRKPLSPIGPTPGALPLFRSE